MPSSSAPAARRGAGALVTARALPEPLWWAQAFEAQRRQLHDELIALAPWAMLPRAADPAAWARLDGLLTLAETARLDHPQPAAAILRGRPRSRAPPRPRLTGSASCARSRCAAASSPTSTTTCSTIARAGCWRLGYNVVDHRLDASCYDLLPRRPGSRASSRSPRASCRRSTGFSFGRQLTTSHGRPALLSWSGSMFEYLMPLLVMPTYDGTLLDETYRAIVERQIAYGRERGVPWGGLGVRYYKTDAQLNYQYRAFGVPGLGSSAASPRIWSSRRTPARSRSWWRPRPRAPISRPWRAAICSARMGSTRRSTTPQAACRRARITPWCDRTWRTTKA